MRTGTGSADGGDVAKARSAKTPVPAIDRDKLRAALRRIGDEYVYYMLDEALDLLPDAALAKIAAKYMRLEELRPDPAARLDLLAEVRRFDAASRGGHYYESFNVNSRNFMDLSPGTRSFIADCHRLLDRCVAQASKGDAAEIREAIELVMGVLRYIDECNDDVVFFADEGGAWQVGVDWAKVLPAWFACLSRTASPDEYASQVVKVVDEFDQADRKKQLAAAGGVATASQRKALDAATATRRSRGGV